MREKILGIEIGHAHIKIIEAVIKRDRKHIIKYSILETPLQSVHNGVIQEVSSIYQVIKEELKNKKYKAKKVVCVVQSSLIVNRQVVMDKYSAKTMRQLLEIKAEDFLPIHDSTYEIDFNILEEVYEEGQMKNKVLMVAIPTAVIEPVMEVIRRLRLSPVMLTVPAEGIMTLINQRKADSDNMLIIDIGEHLTNLIAVYQGKEYLNKVIEFGVGGLNDRNIGKAEKGKDAWEYKMLHQIEYKMIAEIERFIQYFYNQYEKGTISKIHLLGGGSRIEEVKRYIEDALNIPVKEFNYLEGIEGLGEELGSDRNLIMNLAGAVFAV